VVKIAVLVAAVFGIANMWFAVFADTGVALLVIVNSMRLLGGSWAGTARLPVKSE
jgi:Cd2+/Zn2+-exporting ATPase